ncbi:MAG TPA: sulfotransferase [Bryobacteraceae bacterium]|nr:sulfotransferase [Bryobacteraceae bacterium]
MNAGPIFIVGAPRSGTTLLRQMLSRHPRIAICGETHFLTTVYNERTRRVFGDLRDEANRQRLIDAYLATRRAQRGIRMDFSRLKERLLRDGDSLQSLFAAILKAYAESQGKQRWGEKTPQHARFTELLFEWYPDALLLHVVRDPRDVVASLLRRPAAANSAVLNARAWLRLNLAARRSQARPGYLEVRYEALTAEPEEQLRKICRCAGEEYSSSMLSPEQQELERSSAMDRFRTPLSTDRLGTWRQDLSPIEAAQIESTLGGQMETFGYSRQMPPASALTRWRGASFAAFDTARMAFQKLPALWYYYTAPTDLASYERWRFPPGEKPHAPQIERSIGA